MLKPSSLFKPDDEKRETGTFSDKVRGAYPNLCLSGKRPTKIREFGAKSGTRRNYANFLLISLKTLIGS